MLTAVTVLVLLVVLLGQSVGTMSRTWLAGQRRVNNFTKARAMLDMFARDVQSGLFRPDLAAFPPGSDATFYTQRQGIPGDGSVPRGVSLVQYRFDGAGASNVAVTTLERGDLAVPWDAASAPLVSFGDSTNFPHLDQVVYRSTAPGVIAFKIAFILADGTLSPTYAQGGANPARAVGLTLAVVDDQTLKLLSPQQVSALRLGFNAAADGTRNVQGDWQRYLATLDWNSYPKNLGDSLRVFARYVPFPSM